MVEVEDGTRGRGGQCVMEADDDARDQIDREREGEREGEGEGGAAWRGITRGKSQWLEGSRVAGDEEADPKQMSHQKSVHALFFLVVGDILPHWFELDLSRVLT